MPIIPDTQEVEIRRIVAQGNLRQEVSVTPSQPQARHCACICNHSYTGGTAV
jgi:hypothetical protein